ncbi:hypothetical protein K457DRAFT_135684 [Linnemannia elongata AG-77]|uniref:F-box domain-containing protein n=1 Tax=Linnemannia elongata AG-77 TaxID=1314771 RepID=A0A197K404_9FUNG|nr:hypothetical protein K457DRAFT_135684 [Linnemannia elongata AG-77]
MPDFIPPGLNPLIIPEIVVMVGQQIPLCRRTILPDPYTGSFTFNTIPVTLFAPKDLLACTAVCQAWRRILIPVLWRYYDGALMRYVPLQVLQKASVYFRIFRDPIGQYHQGPFFSTHLQQLIISQQHEWAVPFLDANPALQHLTWTGLGRPLTDQQFMALARMAQLRDLCLSNCSLVGRSLASVLNGSPGLLRLSLSSVDGITQLDGLSTMSSLEEIALGYLSVNSRCAVLNDLTRFCPNLRRISFLGTWGPTDDDAVVGGAGRRQGRDLLKLSSTLRVFCPELQSIQFTAGYCFGIDRFNTLQDFELAALAESAERLTSFGAEISTLGRMLTDTLICKSRTLVAVDLCIRRRYPHQHPHDGGGGGGGGGTAGFGLQGGALVSAGNTTTGEGGLFELDILDHGIEALAKHSYWDESEESMHDGSGQSQDIVNAARILTHCSNLRVFRLTSDEKWIRMEEAMALFARPWACLGLEVLSLGHISMPASPPSTSTRKRKTPRRTTSSGSCASSPAASASGAAKKRPTKRTRPVASAGSSSPKSVVATPISMGSSYPSPSPSPSLVSLYSVLPSPKTISRMQISRSTALVTEPGSSRAVQDSGREAADGMTNLLDGDEGVDWALFPDGSSLVSPPSISSPCFSSPLRASSSMSNLTEDPSLAIGNTSSSLSSLSSQVMSRTSSYASTPSGSSSSSETSSSCSASASSSSSKSRSSSQSNSADLSPPPPTAIRKTTWRRSRSRSASVSTCSSTSLISSSTVSLSDDDEGEDGWKFGDEFKQRLVPQVTLLTVLRELCLNKVRYARTTIV